MTIGRNDNAYYAEEFDAKHFRLYSICIESLSLVISTTTKIYTFKAFH
jgi:hypothetical protein